MKEVHSSSLLSLIAISFIGTTIRLLLSAAAFCSKLFPKEAKSCFGLTAHIKSIICHYSNHGIHVIDIGTDRWSHVQTD